jgi:CBS domain-containing protein
VDAVHAAKGAAMTQVVDVMTRDVQTLTPDDTVMLAAQAMDELDVGAIPVCDGDRLIGMITDRDIAVRAVAQNLAGETTRLEDVMTDEPLTCYEDQSVEDVLETMREAQLRRLPVIDQHRRLVGIVSLGDLATSAGDDDAGDTLKAVSEPNQPPAGDAARDGESGPRLKVRVGPRGP